MNCFQLKDTSRIWNLSVMSDTGLDPGAENNNNIRNISGTTGKFWIRPEDYTVALYQC